MQALWSHNQPTQYNSTTITKLVGSGNEYSILPINSPPTPGAAHQIKGPDSDTHTPTSPCMRPAPSLDTCQCACALPSCAKAPQTLQ